MNPKIFNPAPPNINAPVLHGPAPVRMVPHLPKQAFRQALVEQLNRDSLDGRGGQQKNVEQHNAAKKMPKGLRDNEQTETRELDQDLK